MGRLRVFPWQLHGAAAPGAAFGGIWEGLEEKIRQIHGNGKETTKGFGLGFPSPHPMGFSQPPSHRNDSFPLKIIKEEIRWKKLGKFSFSRGSLKGKGFYGKGFLWERRAHGEIPSQIWERRWILGRKNPGFYFLGRAGVGFSWNSFIFRIWGSKGTGVLGNSRTFGILKFPRIQEFLNFQDLGFSRSQDS